MKHRFHKKLTGVLLFVAGIVLSWSGMIYATNKAFGFRPTGVVAAIVGYGLVFWAVRILESLPDRSA